MLEVQNFKQQNTTKCVYIQQRPTATGLGGSRLEGVRLWTSMPSMPSVYATTVCQGVDHSKLWVLISRVFSATAHSRRTKLQKVFGMKPKDWHKHFTTAFNPGRRHYMKVRKLTTKDKKNGSTLRSCSLSTRGAPGWRTKIFRGEASVRFAWLLMFFLWPQRRGSCFRCT